MNDEINLRDLIEILIRGKRIIAGVFLVAIIIAGILSIFLLPVRYEAKALLIFDKKFMEQQGLSIKSYDEIIKDFTMMQSLIDQLNLDKKEFTASILQDTVETKVDEKTNQIVITFSGEDPQMTQEIVNKLGVNSVMDFKKRLIYDKERQIEQGEIQLKDIEQQLNYTPKLLGTTEIKNQGGQVVQIPQVNPMYEILSSRWDEVNYSLSQLKAERDYLEKGIESGGKGLYIIFNKAPLPEKPVSPRKMINIAVAGVLGLMAGVFLVLFLEFWRNSNSETKKTPDYKRGLC